MAAKKKTSTRTETTTGKKTVRFTADISPELSMKIQQAKLMGGCATSPVFMEQALVAFVEASTLMTDAVKKQILG